MTESTQWTEGVRVLISEAEIQAKVTELGKAITRDYADEELTLVGVLKGSFLFMADLCRHIELPLTCDFLGLSSYHGETRTSGVIRITSDLNQPVEGRHVLVVEDIIDTGLTMEYLLENLRTRLPRSIKVCSLLHKPERKKVDTPIDYLGFTVPNEFVVGYGLDYLGRYRNLRFVGVMENVE
jgi:hypoxanthine phosphoribosyltransferase